MLEAVADLEVRAMEDPEVWVALAVAETGTTII
jgi:hypothetical protein